MAHRIYTPEFKDEAAAQVVECGDTVKEVAARLGISEAEELLKAKRENLTLRAEVGRTQEKRDILTEAVAYVARQPG